MGAAITFGLCCWDRKSSLGTWQGEDCLALKPDVQGCRCPGADQVCASSSRSWTRCLPFLPSRLHQLLRSLSAFPLPSTSIPPQEPEGSFQWHVGKCFTTISLWKEQECPLPAPTLAGFKLPS